MVTLHLTLKDLLKRIFRHSFMGYREKPPEYILYGQTCHIMFFAVLPVKSQQLYLFT